MYKFLTFVVVLCSIMSFHPHSASASVKASEIINLTNKERVKNGLLPLKADGRLMKSAQLKAQDMAKRHYEGHKDPDGKYAWYLFKNQKYFFKYVSENLAYEWSNLSRSQDILTAWLGSSGHRKNIMNKRVKDIGVAVVEVTNNGKKDVIVVQHFGTT